MKNYNINDDNGIKKGEIRNEYGNDNYGIYDDHGSKIGEVRPKYSSGGSSSGAGCLVIPLGILLEIIMVVSGGIIFQIPDIIIFIITAVVNKRKYGKIYNEENGDVLVFSVALSFIIKSIVFIVIFSCSDGRGFHFSIVLISLGISLITTIPMIAMVFVIMIININKSK